MPALAAPAEALARLRREIDRTAIRATNGLKHLSGFSAADVGQTAKELVWTRDKVRLYRYRPSESATVRRPPLLLVMSLVTRPYVFDLQPGNSLVAQLLQDGHDVYLLDWGIPDAVEAGNTLETYCDEYIPRAVLAAATHSEAEGLTLFGYCLGGVLCLLSVAGNPELPLNSLALLATPVDFAELGPMANLLKGGLDPGELLDDTGNVPASTILEGFRMGSPTGDVHTYMSLWNSLSDSRALAAHQALVRWSGDHIPFPGGAFKQIVELLIRQRRLVDGRVPLGGREVDLGTITLPVLDIIGIKDHLVPRPASEPLASVLPNAKFESLHLPAGHAGLILGRKAQREFIPAIIEWLNRYSLPLAP